MNLIFVEAVEKDLLTSKGNFCFELLAIFDHFVHKFEHSYHHKTNKFLIYLHIPAMSNMLTMKFLPHGLFLDFLPHFLGIILQKNYSKEVEHFDHKYSSLGVARVFEAEKAS